MRIPDTQNNGAPTRTMQYLGGQRGVPKLQIWFGEMFEGDRLINYTQSYFFVLYLSTKGIVNWSDWAYNYH